MAENGQGGTGQCPSSGRVPPIQRVPLVDQLGGPEAMASILIPAVEIFYCKLLGDARINYFFAGVDTERLKNKQVEFMAFVFGSPEHYTGKDIVQAHQRLIDEKGLNETHFDIVIEHFIATMKELNVPDTITEQAVEILMTSRPVFERRPTEADKYQVAMQRLKELEHEKVRALRDVKGKLKDMGVEEAGQLQLLRSAVRVRGGSAVEGGLDEYLRDLIEADNKVDG